MSPKNPFEHRRITIDDLKASKRQKELDWRDKVNNQRESLASSKKIDVAHVRAGVGESIHVQENKDLINKQDQEDFNKKRYEKVNTGDVDTSHDSSEGSIGHGWYQKKHRYTPEDDGFLYKNKKDEIDSKRAFREMMNLAYEKNKDNKQNIEKVKKATERLFHDVFLGYSGFSEKVINSISIDKKREIIDSVLGKMDEEISLSEFENFIETGKISNKVIERIAQALFKKDRELSPHEFKVLNNEVESLKISQIKDNMKLEELKSQKLPESKIEKKPSPLLGDKENKKTIQAKVRILKHDIKLIQSEITKNKKESKDTSILDDNLKKLENELAEKESILDFYDTGLTKEEVNKLSGVREYVDQKKRDQKILELGFSEEDILGLTENEKIQILQKNLNKKEFFNSYAEYVNVERKKGSSPRAYTYEGSAEKQEAGIVRLEKVLEHAKKEKNEKVIKEVSEKIKQAKDALILLKRGFSWADINNFSEEEKRKIIDTYQTRGMYIESGKQDDYVPAVKEGAIDKKPSQTTVESSAEGDVRPKAFELANKIEEDLIKAEGYLLDAKNKGEKLRIEFYEKEVDYLKGEFEKQVQKALNQKEAGVSDVDTAGQEGKEEQEELYELEEETINPNENPVYKRTKTMMTLPEIERRLQKNGDPDIGPQNLDEEIAGAQKVIEGLQGLGSSSALEIIEEKKARIKELERIKAGTISQEVNNKEVSIEPGFVITENNPDSVVPLAGEEGLPKIKFSGLFEDAKEELSKNGWTKEEFEALSEEERSYVFWRGIKEENYSRNKEVQEKDPSKDDEERKIAVGFVNMLSKKTDEAGKVTLTEAEEAIYKKYQTAIDAEIERRKLEPANEEELKGVSEGARNFLKKERYDLTAKGVSPGAKEFIKGELNSKIDPEIEETLREKFNISPSEMLRISPEFFSLDPEKQQYLISKLEQKIYLDADLSSKDQNEEEIKKMGWFKKIGASFGKDGRQARLRDKAIEKIKNEGLQNYKDDISVLGKYLIDAPELTYIENEKGKLVPRFKYIETGSSGNIELEDAKIFFNAAASRFGEIPYEWSLKTATNTQQEAYRMAQQSYVSAKNALSKTMLGDVEKQYPGASKDGAEEEIAGKYRDAQMEAMLMIRKADAGVNFGRYITQNPEMEKMTSTWLQKTLGTDLGNWGRGVGYAAAGFAIKLGGRATGVGILVSGAVGGFLADRKKRLEFEGKERTKRYGKSSDQIISLEAQIEEKVKEIQKVRSEKGDQSAIEEDRLTNEVSDLSKQRRKLLVESGIKENISSESVHERLEKLVNQFEKTTNEKSKARILETIKTRLFVTDEMMRDGRINFGKSKDQVMNQFKLSDLMSKASILVEMNGGFGENINNEVIFDKFDNSPQKEEQVFQRFKQFIKDDKAQSERDKARRMAALKGAGVAMLGFGAGALGRHGLGWAVENGYLPSIPSWEKIKDLWPSSTPSPEDAGGIKPSPVYPEPTPEEVPYETFKSVDNLNRGMIGGIQDLQRAIRAEFPIGQEPPQYKEFLEKDAHDIAREWGTYRPGEENESAKVFKGAKFEIGKNGEVLFIDHKGAMQKVFTPEVGASKNFEGDFFAAGGSREGIDIAGQSEYSPESGYESPARPEQANEGYVRSSEIKPDTASSWYETQTKEGYGYNPVRGSYEVVRDANGKLVDLDTRKTISDDLIKFRQNPRNFLVEDLSKTDLLAKTDSFAIKTLTDNRGLIEPYIIERNILNDSTITDLTESDRAELAKKLEVMAKDISAKTGGAFDARPEEIKVSGSSRPSRVTFFDTDNPAEAKPKINPSVTSVSEGSDFVPEKNPTPESVTSDNVTKISEVPRSEELEIRKTNSGTVEVTSSTPEEKTYSFNTENVKGSVRFVLNKDGVIENIQTSSTTSIKGGDINSILKENWQSEASKFSTDNRVGVGKITSGANILMKYERILQAGEFPVSSPEYKYLTGEIEFLKGRLKEVLK